MFDFHFQPFENRGELIPCFFKNVNSSPNSPILVRREFYSAGSSTGPHHHIDFSALYIVRAGQGVHNIDGIPFGISRGDVYLMPPGATHTYLDYQNLEIDAFYFPISIWDEDELAALREISGFWRLFMESEARRIHLRPEAHQQVENAIAELRAESVKQGQAIPLLLHLLLFRLLVMLSRHAASEPASDTSEASPAAPLRLAELLSWCEANVSSDISVAQLAGRMFFSPAHFARLFKREMGVPPATYLRRLKLERARGQLENTRLSVAQIAQESGFESAAHFSRTFRACYGASPLEFRRKAGK